MDIAGRLCSVAFVFALGLTSVARGQTNNTCQSAAIWSSGYTYTNISVPGSFSTSPRAINTSGQIVGYYNTSVYLATTTRPSTMILAIYPNAIGMASFLATALSRQLTSPAQFGPRPTPLAIQESCSVPTMHLWRVPKPCSNMTSVMAR